MRQEVAERRYWRDRMNELLHRIGAPGLDPRLETDELMPPLELVQLIHAPNKADPEIYFASAHRAAVMYLSALAKHGFLAHRAERILDFGVGLGRLLSNYLSFPAELHGIDATPEVVNWVAGSLGPRAQIRQNSHIPPLPYPDGYFDYVYSNSVFTHIQHKLQDQWICELARVTRPGGFAIATFLDANLHFSSMSPSEFDRWCGGRGWAERGFDQGPNIQGLFFAEREWIEQAWTKYWHIIDFIPRFQDQSHLVIRRR